MAGQPLSEDAKAKIRDYDFLTIEASIEEAGEMLAFLRNECQLDYVQHIAVPGQVRDLVTFAFPADTPDYGRVAELSSEYQRPMYDGVLVTRRPYREASDDEIIQFMEKGYIGKADDDEGPDVDLDADDDDEVDKG